MKNKIIKLLILVLTASLLLSISCASSNRENKSRITEGTWGPPSLISNMFGADASTQLVVQWHNFTANQQILQLIEESGSFDDPLKKIELTGTSFSSTGENGEFEQRYIYRTTVTDLSPDTTYKYRVGGGEHWSDTFTHQTASASFEEFSFTVVTDPQSSLHREMRVVMEKAAEYDADNRFFLMCGDVTDEIGLRPSEIESYTNTANLFNIRTPIAATQGNHDTYGITGNNVYRFNTGTGTAGTPGTIYNAFVAFPRNGYLTDETKALSYFFHYNDVLFISLNSFVASNTAGHTPQANWVRSVLEDDKNKPGGPSKYIVVFTHVVFFDCRNANQWLVKEHQDSYMEIFTQYEVDVVFSGHDHMYARTGPVTKTGNTINRNASEGVIYNVVSTTGPKYYNATANTDSAYIVASATQAEQYATVNGVAYCGIFVNVKVTDDKLVVTAVRADGELIDEYEIAAKR